MIAAPRRLHALVCAAAALLVALPSVRNGFSLDAYLVLDDLRVHDFSLLALLTQPWGAGAGGAEHALVNASYFRPLTELLYACEHRAFGAHPAGWHLVSAALHVGATLSCLALARRLTRHQDVAVAAALLFAVHPVHAEAITVVAYQTTLLSALLGLACLRAFGRLLDGGSAAWIVAAGVTAALALAAKEEAAALPLLALAWIALERPAAPRRGWLGVAAIAAGVGLVLAARAAVVRPAAVDYFAGQPRATIACTMLGVAGLYAELLLAPLRLCHFYDWFIVPFSTGLDAAVLRGGACVIAVAATIAWAARRRPPLAIALGWLALGMLPAAHLVPMLNIAGERMLYAPSIGGCIAGGVAWAAASRRWPRAAGALGVALLLGLGARTAARIADFRDDRTLLTAEARDFPETPTPLLYLADLDEQDGDLAAARAHLEAARARAPGWRPVEDRLRAATAR